MQMPLLLVIAGAASWFSLDTRNGSRYMLDRVKRLLVPFLFGMVAILPPVLYIYNRTVPQLSASFPTFLQFYPDYFVFDFADLTGRTNGTWTPEHLWFIMYLFGYSALALPLFQFLRRPNGKRLAERGADFFVRPGTLFLLAIPLVLASATPVGGPENPLLYLIWFVYGYFLLCDPRFQEVLDRHTLSAFILAILSTVFTFSISQSAFPAWSPLWILWSIIYISSRWFWVVAILGLGHHFLNSTNRVLRYANEAAFPFYILHYPVNTLIGYLLVAWNAAIAIKYSVIVVLTITFTLVLYEILIRHFNPRAFSLG